MSILVSASPFYGFIGHGGSLTCSSRIFASQMNIAFELLDRNMLQSLNANTHDFG